MRLHRITVVGIIVSIAGWLWLTLGVSIGLPEASRAFANTQSVVNLQLMALAQQLCLVGYMLVIAGVITSGFEWVREGLSKNAAPAPVAPSTGLGRNSGGLDSMAGGGYKFKAID